VGENIIIYQLIKVIYSSQKLVYSHHHRKYKV